MFDLIVESQFRKRKQLYTKNFEFFYIGLKFTLMLIFYSKQKIQCTLYIQMLFRYEDSSSVKWLNQCFLSHFPSLLPSLSLLSEIPRDLLLPRLGPEPKPSNAEPNSGSPTLLASPESLLPSKLSSYAALRSSIRSLD